MDPMLSETERKLAELWQDYARSRALLEELEASRQAKEPAVDAEASALGDAAEEAEASNKLGVQTHSEVQESAQAPDEKPDDKRKPHKGLGSLITHWFKAKLVTSETGPDPTDTTDPSLPSPSGKSATAQRRRASFTTLHVNFGIGAGGGGLSPVSPIAPPSHSGASASSSAPRARGANRQPISRRASFLASLTHVSHNTVHPQPLHPGTDCDSAAASYSQPLPGAAPLQGTCTMAGGVTGAAVLRTAPRRTSLDGPHTSLQATAPNAGRRASLDAHRFALLTSGSAAPASAGNGGGGGAGGGCEAEVSSPWRYMAQRQVSQAVLPQPRFLPQLQLHEPPQPSHARSQRSSAAGTGSARGFASDTHMWVRTPSVVDVNAAALLDTDDPAISAAAAASWASAAVAAASPTGGSSSNVSCINGGGGGGRLGGTSSTRLLSAKPRRTSYGTYSATALPLGSPSGGVGAAGGGDGGYGNAARSFSVKKVSALSFCVGPATTAGAVAWRASMCASPGPLPATTSTVPGSGPTSPGEAAAAGTQSPGAAPGSPLGAGPHGHQHHHDSGLAREMQAMQAWGVQQHGGDSGTAAGGTLTNKQQAW